MSSMLLSCGVGRSVYIVFMVLFPILSSASSRISLESKLRKAAASGNISRCTMLLSQGAQINSAGTDDYTALHYSSQEGHVDVCRLLLERGANIRSRQKDGASSLYIASQ